MKLAFDYALDLGDLGERDCFIEGEVVCHHGFSRDTYEVYISKVIVPWLDGMNVSGLLTMKAFEQIEQEMIGQFKGEMDVARSTRNSKRLEQAYA